MFYPLSPVSTPRFGTGSETQPPVVTPPSDKTIVRQRLVRKSAVQAIEYLSNRIPFGFILKIFLPESLQEESKPVSKKTWALLGANLAGILSVVGLGYQWHGYRADIRELKTAHRQVSDQAGRFLALYPKAVEAPASGADPLEGNGRLSQLKNSVMNALSSGADPAEIRAELLDKMPENKRSKVGKLLTALESRKNPESGDYAKTFSKFVKILLQDHTLTPSVREQLEQSLQRSFEEGLAGFEFPDFAAPADIDAKRHAYLLYFMIALTTMTVLTAGEGVYFLLVKPKIELAKAGIQIAQDAYSVGQDLLSTNAQSDASKTD